MSTIPERLGENITSATALVVIGLSLVAYAFGVPYIWLFFVVGLFVIVPLVGLLFGAEDWRKWDPFSDEFWEDIFGEESPDINTPEASTESLPKENALSTLRDRYARGELTDEQFERKLVLLLETESLESIEERFSYQKERDRIAEYE